MKPKQSFPERVLLRSQKKLSLRVRAGTGAHRFIGIWFVVVEGRVFVRSWSIKPDGWYREFLREARGAIQIDKAEMAVRAVPVRSKTLRDAVDRPYLKRYSAPGALKIRKGSLPAKISGNHDGINPTRRHRCSIVCPSNWLSLPFPRTNHLISSRTSCEFSRLQNEMFFTPHALSGRASFGRNDAATRFLFVF